MAQTLSVKLKDFERIDHMTMHAEARRNAALREIDRHRDVVTRRLRVELRPTAQKWRMPALMKAPASFGRAGEKLNTLAAGLLQIADYVFLIPYACADQLRRKPTFGDADVEQKAAKPRER